ncbi:interferon alpha/beta receptor 2-like isoform X1 [Seriola aureovittata]|uniref:interferon alpha/beta receptor 2-like isoform X1 n=1 Tax=Seriola aureovittata TaxID=2871759 RepID=UPI0024BEE3A5|nr:interferon alpha/beta receptor 2-like isoform X1 [Seriola aureovittata]
MELWMLLLLHLQLANAPWIEGGRKCCCLTPSTFQRLHLFLQHGAYTQLPPRCSDALQHPLQCPNHPPESSWRPVVGCLELKAAQMCNLTTAFKDPYTQYRARVQAFTATQASNWTVSGWFQPLSDTVLGPPGVSVSGCGNCLILQLRLPVTRGGQQNLQLENLYRTVELHVQRTRDETQFRLSLPYKEETVITYLQPGVEYCVTITVTTYFSSNSVSSRPYCAFTSPPPPTTSAYLVFGLLGASCMLVLFFIGLMVHGGWLSSSRTLLQNEDSTNWLLTAHSPTPPLRSCSAGGEDDCED